MPESQRSEFHWREDNVIFPMAFSVQDVRRGVRRAGSAEEMACDPGADLRVGIAAIPYQDTMLMVGG
jgi:hypothetical protein